MFLYMVIPLALNKLQRVLAAVTESGLKHRNWLVVNCVRQTCLYCCDWVVHWWCFLHQLNCCCNCKRILCMPLLLTDCNCQYSIPHGWIWHNWFPKYLSTTLGSIHDFISLIRKFLYLERHPLYHNKTPVALWAILAVSIHTFYIMIPSYTVHPHYAYKLQLSHCHWTYVTSCYTTCHNDVAHNDSMNIYIYRERESVCMSVWIIYYWLEDLLWYWLWNYYLSWC